MAKKKPTFGQSKVSPKGVIFFADVDTPMTQEKHPKAQYPSNRFDVTIGVPKDTDLSEHRSECEKVAEEAFGTTEGIAMPFADGDKKSMDTMKGMWILRAKMKPNPEDPNKKPGVVSDIKVEGTDKYEKISESSIQAGMWGHLHFTPMSYEAGATKGVTLLLKNLQVLTQEEYEPLGPSSDNPQDVF